MPTRLRLIIAIVLATVSTVLTLGLLASTAKYFDQLSDFPEYICAAHMMASGQGNLLYDGKAVISEHKRLFPTLRDRDGLSVLSPPPAFPLFLPLSLVPIDIAKLLWQPILVLAVALSILLLRKAYFLSARGTAWLWAVTFLMGPLFEALKIGQISTLLMLVLTTSILLFKRSRDFWAGAVLAVFVLKPQELVTVMLFLIGAGRWQAIKGFASGIGLLAIISFFTAGSAVYAQYLSLGKNLKSFNYVMMPQLTATVRGQLMRLNLDYDLVQAISLAALLGACLFSFWWGKRQAKNANWLDNGIAVTLPLGLTTALLVHFYDLVLLVPAAIALINSPLAKTIPNAFTFLGVLMIGTLMLPIAILIHYNWVLSTMPLNPYALMMILASALLVYFAIKSQWTQSAAVQNETPDPGTAS